MVRLRAVVLVLLSATPAAAQTPAPVPGATDALYQFLLARRLESSGDAEGALAALKRAQSLDPKSAELHAELAGYHARANQTEDAVAEGERALKIDPANEEAHHILAMVYSAGAENAAPPPAGLSPETLRQRAIEHLSAILSTPLMATDPNLQMTLGRLHLRSGHADQAVPILERVVAQAPWAAEPWALLAEAQSTLGRLDDAAESLRSAADISPRYWAVLGDLYDRQGKAADAAGAYGSAVENVRTPSRDLRLRWATALLKVPGGTGAAKARSIATDLLSSDPADPRALYVLSSAQRASGDAKAAEATARQIIAVDPASVSGLSALAFSLFDRYAYRQVVDALTPFEKDAAARAKGREGEGAQVLVQLGIARQQLGEYDAAIAAYNTARNLTPRDPEINAYLIEANLAARRFDAADVLAQENLARMPGQPRFLRLRAQALAKGGRASEAVSLLEGGLAVRPDSRELLVGLADLYADQKRTDDAVRLLQQAQTTFGGDEALAMRLANAYETGGRLADAEREFRRLIDQDPTNGNALNSLSYMFAVRGLRGLEALELAERAVKLEPDNPAYLDTLGWALFQLGKTEQAAEPLARAAGALAGSSVIQEHHGDVLARRGKSAEAIEAWERALAGDGESIDRAAVEKKIRDARARRR